MHNIIEALHIAPLLVMVAIFSVQFAWKLFKKQILIIQQLDPILLILSAIGIAAGANAHGHELAHSLFDPCFGYAAVLMCISARMLGLFQKLRHKHA